MFRELFLLVAIAMCASAHVVTPPVDPCSCGSGCPIENRMIVHALDNCICRPFHNQCFMEKESADRVKAGKSPLVPLAECICKKFRQLTCPNPRVTAEISFPAVCGCPYIAGPIKNMTFDSMCHLHKYSGETGNPFLNVYPAPVPTPEEPCDN
ncbi:salivary glue protein Sgs-5-like [Drosophila busckii]|uniref:salivary glue protein Sgs-5-like n=1 Tax=Drosophila busckii TaxID=30019 RepID=UPI00083F0F2C|nr:salivary glue protein Sgs-5-like [Drosophila busckii]